MIDPTALDVLHQTIGKDLPNAPWLPLLETVAVTGVANSLHLRTATGLERDALNRLIAKLNQLAGKLPPVLVELNHSLPRLGQRGRAPNVYLLGETGAALLRLVGHADTTASGLKQDTPIAHALDMLDVHLAARQAGIMLTTDGVIEFGDDRAIRPDHLVCPTADFHYLIENEQAAGADLLRRMRESVQHRVDFFTSAEGSQVQPIVRMLISLPRGKVFEETLHYWDQAIRSVFVRHPQPPYRIIAMPLGEFLNQPNWNADPLCDDHRWIDLTPTHAPQSTQLTFSHDQPAASTTAITKAPAEWLRTSPHDDLLLLEALWQDFNERAVTTFTDIPDPDPKFFALMRLIYAASHDSSRSIIDRAGFPRASVYLLMRYLQIHPKLRETLAGSMKRGASASRWNVTLIRQWMQTLVDQFLAYHGFASGDTLWAQAVVTDWHDEEAQHAIDVQVYLTSGELLMPREASGVVPGRDEIHHAARALAWVLHALFAHAQRIGLGKPPAFW
jgi:hypothetical protein